MSQAIQQIGQAGHVAGVTDTVFEPEILAFCCEH